MVGVFGEIPFPEAGEEDDDFYRFIELEEQFVPAEKRGPREGEFGAGDWRLQEGGVLRRVARGRMGCGSRRAGGSCPTQGTASRWALTGGCTAA